MQSLHQGGSHNSQYNVVEQNLATKGQQTMLAGQDYMELLGHSDLWLHLLLMQRFLYLERLVLVLSKLWCSKLLPTWP